jgi:thiamine biosynthesis lipoprotein
MNQVVLYPDRGVELQRDGVRIDTGGIGNGYAVDLIAQLFKSNGIKAALINFGQSSVIANDSPARRPGMDTAVTVPGP